MTKNKARGGEPDGLRLLDLARAELLNEILPHLEGDARYRAKLIANALKIAASELQAPVAGDGDTESALAGLVPGAASLTEALRAGALDGNAEVHALLVRLTERRRAALG